MQETFTFLKKVLFLDIIIGFIISIVISLFFKSYLIPFLLGLISVMVSFVINAFSINYSFNLKKKNYGVLSVISLMLRILLICGIAIILINTNKYYVFPYILGYTCNFISFILYGLLC